MSEPSIKNPRTFQRWLIAYPRALPWVLFAVLALITVISVVAIEAVDDSRERTEMERLAESAKVALQRQASLGSASLQAGSALLASAPRFSPELFRAYAKEFRTNSGFSGVQAIGWAQALSPSQIPDFERNVANATKQPFAVRSAPGDASRVVPVTYLFPMTSRNRRALGYDMYSEPVRRAAMDDAERSREPTATRSLVLQQEGEGTAPGFIVYMPVSRSVSGQGELRGYIYNAFNAHDFVEAALDGLDLDGRGLVLYDQSASPENELARFGNVGGFDAISRRPFEIANHTMVLEVQAPSGAGLSTLSILTLIFGLAVAGLLALVVRLLTQQAHEDQVSLEKLREQDSIRDCLTRELNHRVKNTLANVLSIMSLTRRRTDDLDEFADALDGRIRSLSATHDLLTKSEWNTTPLRSILTTELAPYAIENERRIELLGPDLELAPNDALSLGLAVHELATNAAKFGALSVPGGMVSITWLLTNDGHARIHWRESGGPRVGQPEKKGFGTDLIEKIVAHELRSPVELRFEEAGVECTLMAPVRTRSDFTLRGG